MTPEQDSSTLEKERVLLSGALAAAVVVGSWSGVTELWRSLALAAAIAAILLLSSLAHRPTQTHAFQFTIAATYALMFLVKWEPAPADLLVPLALGVGVVFGIVKWPRHRFSSLFFLLVGLLCISQVASTIPSRGIGTSVFYSSITVLVLFMAVLSFVVSTSMENTALLVKSFAYGAAVSTVLGLIVVMKNIHIGVELEWGGARFQGFFKDPNVFAPYLVLAIMLLISHRDVASLGPPPIAEAVRWAAIGVMTYAVIIAYSRGAWVNLVAAVLGFWLLRNLSSGAVRWKSITLILLCLPLVYFAITNITIPQDSLFSERLQVQKYDTNRFETQRTALALFWERPFFGYGPGMFKEVGTIATHNGYLRLLFENGLFGLLPFVALLVGGVLISLKSALRAQEPWQQGLAAACCSALVGTAVNSFVIDTVHWRHLWILIGLAWASGAWATAKAQGTVDIPEPVRQEVTVTPDPACPGGPRHCEDESEVHAPILPILLIEPPPGIQQRHIARLVRSRRNKPVSKMYR